MSFLLKEVTINILYRHKQQSEVAVTRESECYLPRWPLPRWPLPTVCRCDGGRFHDGFTLGHIQLFRSQGRHFYTFLVEYSKTSRYHRVCNPTAIAKEYGRVSKYYVDYKSYDKLFEFINLER